MHSNKERITSRKEKRKDERLKKKQRKMLYYNRKKNSKVIFDNRNEPGKYVKINNHTDESSLEYAEERKIESFSQNKSCKNVEVENELNRKKLKRLQGAMKKQRIKSLHRENKEEDKTIKQLEKKLKLHKRKSKTVPKSFVNCGLDYILDVCDSENIEAAVTAEMNLQDSDSEYEEDLALVTGKKNKMKKDKVDIDIWKTNLRQNFDQDIDVDNEHSEYSSDDESTGISSEYEEKYETYLKKNENKKDQNEDINIENDKLIYKKKLSQEILESDSEDISEDNLPRKIEVKPGNQKRENNIITSMENEYISEKNETVQEISNLGAKVDSTKIETSITEDILENNPQNKRKMISANIETEQNKKSKIVSECNFSDKCDNNDNDNQELGNDNVDVENKESELWEDIYGRVRDKSGNVVEEPKSIYIPPHLKSFAAIDSTKREELERIKKQLKGLLNRLAEKNIYNISMQIDEMYMKHSRHDMNQILLSLYLDSLITSVHTPERLIMEHAMLIAVLHANVGSEVGSFFLQNLVKKFNDLHSQSQEIEDKTLDNLLLILSHLYTFKIYHCRLLYDILNKLCDSFKPKDIDLILAILRSVGFILRKQDPLALKKLILRVQKLANKKNTSMKDDARVRFMLEALLGIKNNNMNKLPGYNPTHSEQLKKNMKVMLRKGNYVTELKISLEELLKADELGRWWIVGSAWSGPAPQQEENSKKDSDNTSSELNFSEVILDLARKQRMNTPNRRTIFCILMTAEDYLDAFQKLLKLDLKGPPEQDIVHVLIHCLLNEASYNPYYALIGAELCQSDRRHQMTIKYSVWDRFKELQGLRSVQITNLAKFLAHLFLHKSLPVSVLKVVEFVELDKAGVRLIRQVMLSIFLFEDKECVMDVFNRIAKPAKLNTFRQSLGLFLHHFVTRSVTNKEDLTKEEKLVQERVQEAVQILNCFS